jgi:hypothetical protein
MKSAMPKPSRLFRFIFIPLAAGLACAASSVAQTTAVDLSAMPVAQPPAGFEFARTGKGTPGQWTVAEDATASKGRATAQDKTFPAAGRIALWTKADSVTRFDAISVTPLP